MAGLLVMVSLFVPELKDSLWKLAAEGFLAE